MTINRIEVPRIASDTIIISVCCVCQKFLGLKDGKGSQGISHGYCCECMSELQKTIQERAN